MEGCKNQMVLNIDYSKKRTFDIGLKVGEIIKLGGLNGDQIF